MKVSEPSPHGALSGHRDSRPAIGSFVYPKIVQERLAFVGQRRLNIRSGSPTSAHRTHHGQSYSRKDYRGSPKDQADTSVLLTLKCCRTSPVLFGVPMRDPSSK